MKTFIAISGNQSFGGGLPDCLFWANEVIGEIPIADTVVKIHRIRPEQKKMRVVAEITPDGIRKIENGREVPIRSFVKAHGG